MLGGALFAVSHLCFYGAALVLLLLERTRPSAGLAAGFLLAGAILTKNEGALLAGAALLLASLRLLHQPRPFAWFVCALGPALAASALLTSWRAAIPNRVRLRSRRPAPKKSGSPCRIRGPSFDPRVEPGLTGSQTDPEEIRRCE